MESVKHAWDRLAILEGALMETNNTGQGNMYRIKVRETLDPRKRSGSAG